MNQLVKEIFPFTLLFFVGLVFTLIVTPYVREMNRRFGMVDKPSPRRINKTPIPRGGGLGLVLVVLMSWVVWLFARDLGFGLQSTEGAATYIRWRFLVLGLGIALLGYADDKYSLKPLTKLAGQIVIAVLLNLWAGLGFANVFPSLPGWVDSVMTVFWVLVVVNAFNLIDGLDGLAAGLAFVATIGMAGSLVLLGAYDCIAFHVLFAGALLGFLRYNYNPASVFLGDCGSMFIGFVIASLPLISPAMNSLFISVGVPLLCIGVPVFDTSLAIVRRTVRHQLSQFSSEQVGNDHVMTADVEHVHHRVLRAVNFNQRKAVWLLYGVTAVLVSLALASIAFSSHVELMWVVAFGLGITIVFREMASVELLDTGRLLTSLAHDKSLEIRKFRSRWVLPYYMVGDVLALMMAALSVSVFVENETAFQALKIPFFARVLCVFIALAVFQVYRVVWSRATVTNYLWLLGACVAGTSVAAVLLSHTGVGGEYPVIAALLFLTIAYTLMLFVRLIRAICREVFYEIARFTLRRQKDIVRCVVYGSGLRYHYFQREMVRLADKNTRVIVGLIDDDAMLTGKYIGTVKVYGNINQLPKILEKTRATELVVACELTEKREGIVKQIIEATGVKATYFTFKEKNKTEI